MWTGIPLAFFQQVDTIEPCHTKVADDGVKLVEIEKTQALYSAARRRDEEMRMLVLQRARHGLQKDGIVIDHEETIGATLPLRADPGTLVNATDSRTELFNNVLLR